MKICVCRHDISRHDKCAHGQDGHGACSMAYCNCKRFDSLTDHQTYNARCDLWHRLLWLQNNFGGIGQPVDFSWLIHEVGQAKWNAYDKLGPHRR